MLTWDSENWKIQNFQNFQNLRNVGSFLKFRTGEINGLKRSGIWSYVLVEPFGATGAAQIHEILTFRVPVSTYYVDTF